MQQTAEVMLTPPVTPDLSDDHGWNHHPSGVLDSQPMSRPGRSLSAVQRDQGSGVIDIGNDHAMSRWLSPDSSSASASAASARAIASSCLLYTSPSPRDGLLSRMPS